MLYDPARHPGDPLPVEIPADVVDFVRQAEKRESAAEG